MDEPKLEITGTETHNWQFEVPDPSEGARQRINQWLRVNIPLEVSIYGCNDVRVVRWKD